MVMVNHEGGPVAETNNSRFKQKLSWLVALVVVLGGLPQVHSGGMK